MDAETPVILGRDGQPTLLTLLIGAETTGILGRSDQQRLLTALVDAEIPVILGRGCRLKLQSQAMESQKSNVMPKFLVARFFSKKALTPA